MTDYTGAMFPARGQAKLVRDERFGFLKIDPMPSEDVIAAFYEHRYFTEIETTSRAPDLSRLLMDDDAAAQERSWLQATIYADAADAFRDLAPGRQTLDVGCGSGDLVAYLVANGFNAEGLDPSPEAVRHGIDRGLKIHQGSIEAFGSQYANRPADYDAISAISVLGCLPDPFSALSGLRCALKPGGVLYLGVGNQFNLFQNVARRVLNKDAWWVMVPDHLCYFDRTSLLAVLDGAGFDLVDILSDFPIEMFLLMGDDYIDRSDVGALCHARRKKFEMSLTKDERRSLYRGFAQSGLGRCIHVVARRREN